MYIFEWPQRIRQIPECALFSIVKTKWSCALPRSPSSFTAPVGTRHPISTSHLEWDGVTYSHVSCSHLKRLQWPLCVADFISNIPLSRFSYVLHLRNAWFHWFWGCESYDLYTEGIWEVIRRGCTGNEDEDDEKGQKKGRKRGRWFRMREIKSEISLCNVVSLCSFKSLFKTLWLRSNCSNVSSERKLFHWERSRCVSLDSLDFQWGSIRWSLGS